MSDVVRVKYQYEEVNVVSGELDIPIDIWEDTDLAVEEYILDNGEAGEDWVSDVEFIEITLLPAE